MFASWLAYEDPNHTKQLLGNPVHLLAEGGHQNHKSRNLKNATRTRRTYELHADCTAVCTFWRMRISSGLQLLDHVT